MNEFERTGGSLEALPNRGTPQYLRSLSAWNYSQKQLFDDQTARTLWRVYVGSEAGAYRLYEFRHRIELITKDNGVLSSLCHLDSIGPKQPEQSPRIYL